MLELFVSNKDFQKDESCLRTIISRSYYASFLHSREFLKIKHKLKSDTTDDHRWVWHKLNDLGLDDQAKYLKFLKFYVFYNKSSFFHRNRKGLAISSLVCGTIAIILVLSLIFIS